MWLIYSIERRVDSYATAPSSAQVLVNCSVQRSLFIGSNWILIAPLTAVIWKDFILLEAGEAWQFAIWLLNLQEGVIISSELSLLTSNVLRMLLLWRLNLLLSQIDVQTVIFFVSAGTTTLFKIILQ